MRKIYRVICGLICWLVIQSSAWAYDFENAGLRYTITSASKLTVKVESGPREGVIIIPATVNYNGHVLTVNEIDGSAFEGASITSVTIPETIEEIGKYAFVGKPCDVSALRLYLEEINPKQKSQIKYFIKITFLMKYFYSCLMFVSTQIDDHIRTRGC